jgi:hypothetical protein
MSTFRENYGENCNNVACKAQPISSTVKQTGQLYSPCEKCPLIYQVRDDRTPFDKYWLQFYNAKAAATDYDLVNLQFAA